MFSTDMLVLDFSEWKQKRVMSKEFCSSLSDTFFPPRTAFTVGGQHLYTLWSLTFPLKKGNYPPNPWYLKTAVTRMEDVVLNDCKQLFEKFHSLALYFPLMVYSTQSLSLPFVFIFYTSDPKPRFPCAIAALCYAI